MLILKLKVTVRRQHIPLSDYYLNHLITHHGSVCLQKIRNYQQAFYVIPKSNGKNGNRDKIYT